MGHTLRDLKDLWSLVGWIYSPTSLDKPRQRPRGPRMLCDTRVRPLPNPPRARQESEAAEGEVVERGNIEREVARGRKQHHFSRHRSLSPSLSASITSLSHNHTPTSSFLSSACIAGSRPMLVSLVPRSLRTRLTRSVDHQVHAC